MDWATFIQKVTECQSDPNLAPLLRSGELSVEDITNARMLKSIMNQAQQEPTEALKHHKDTYMLWRWVEEKGIDHASFAVCLIGKV